MTASLTDILTTAKNLVTAVNQLGQTYLSINGSKKSATLTATTVVASGQVRLVNVTVPAAGTTSGTIYDCGSTTALINPVFAIPTTAGVYSINIPMNAGITVVPGTGQSVVVSYS